MRIFTCTPYIPGLLVRIVEACFRFYCLMLSVLELSVILTTFTGCRRSWHRTPRTFKFGLPSLPLNFLDHDTPLRSVVERPKADRRNIAIMGKGTDKLYVRSLRPHAPFCRNPTNTLPRSPTASGPPRMPSALQPAQTRASLRMPP